MMGGLFRRVILVAAIVLLAGGLAAAQSAARRGPSPFQQPQLTVNSNVPGATVLINDGFVGTTPLSRSLDPGNYRVTVRASGYQDYTTTVFLSGQLTINAYLQPYNYHVTINANVDGASVFVNGRLVGETPYTIVLAPGSYRLRVSAPGYEDYTSQILVNQNLSFNARLVAHFAVLRFRIPDQYLSHRGDYGPGDHRRAAEDVRIFLDNQPVRRESIQVPQGMHTVRFESGGFEVEQSFYFSAGREYVVSPMLSISVH